MQFKLENCLLYAVTDTAWLGEQTLAQQVEEALRGGVTMVQLREKRLTGEALEKEAREILAVCRRFNVPLLINDDVMLAKKIGADGVHVGQSDMAAAQARAILGPDAIIGVTARTVDQALAAEAAGADYLGSGAVFGTSTKKDAKAMDPAYFQQICESVSIPVVAIGGITADNIRQLRGRRMSGFAIVSGIFAADDIEVQTRLLWEAAQELCQETAAAVTGRMVRAGRPVVQCITNIVTVNDCANALLASGASPTMAHHPEEMEEFARVTDALVCNMGATESLEAMLKAAEAARRAGHPLVIDPVGCASSSFRRKKCADLIEAAHPACIRGNAAEIRALAEGRNTGRGVDDAAAGDGQAFPALAPEPAGEDDPASADAESPAAGSPVSGDPGNTAAEAPVSGDPGSTAAEAPVSGDPGSTAPGSPAPGNPDNTAADSRREDAILLARQTGAIVIASGPVDLITDGRRVYEVRGGSALMARVTGTGCMLSSLLGAWLAVENSALGAAACCRMMADCGEEAERRTAAEKGGTGTFHIRLIDALSVFG